MAPINPEQEITPASLPECAQDAEDCQCFYEFRRPTQEEIDQDWELLRRYQAEVGQIQTSIRPALDPTDIVLLHVHPMPCPACRRKKAAS